MGNRTERSIPKGKLKIMTILKVLKNIFWKGDLLNILHLPRSYSYLHDDLITNHSNNFIANQISGKFICISYESLELFTRSISNFGLVLTKRNIRTRCRV